MSENITKPKRSRQPKVSADKGQAVAIWQPMSKPDNLPAEAVTVLPGTVIPMMKAGVQLKDKQGKLRTRTQSGLVVHLPKAVDLMAKHGLTEAGAKDRISAIAKAIKPAVSGRVNQAMASESYGIRRYTESKAGAVTVSLYPVNVSDKAAAISAETGLSIEEVYKRIPELRPKSEPLTVNV